MDVAICPGSLMDTPAGPCGHRIVDAATLLLFLQLSSVPAVRPIFAYWEDCKMPIHCKLPVVDRHQEQELVALSGTPSGAVWGVRKKK